MVARKNDESLNLINLTFNADADGIHDPREVGAAMCRSEECRLHFVMELIHFQFLVHVKFYYPSGMANHSCQVSGV